MESTGKPGPDNPESTFPIVGIGASAGGLNSLVSFLSALPDEFGFALVFMQHLSPSHKSLLPDLLSSRNAALTIEEVSDGLEILPGKLYLCPPAQEVRIENDAFRVTPQSRKHIHLPIDEFFISLAEYAVERAIAVIFSGAGTDGARGVHAVRTAGGTVFVQDPATAEFSAMPLAALGTGQVDAVLTPEDIAREILKFHTSGMVAPSSDGLIAHEHLEPFFRLIHEKTGYRFNHYKKNVISRRIKRRMYLHGLSSVSAYLEKVSADEGEARSLASDLMIGVTSFFRDRLAWEALHLDVTRKLVAEDETSPLRVWTPACATGEEAYSIAMLLRRELDRAGRKREIQVFATDVNDQALEKAREGTYPATIAADVKADYLSAFFTPSEDGLSLTVDKEIRQLVVFAKQDILTDPPFSRLDLVICRNLLIYLEPDAQEKCIALFHYALKDGGYLFLGGAESPGRNKSLFVSLAHKKCRIYRKTETEASARTPLAVPFASEHLPLAARQASSPRSRKSVVELSQEVLLEEFAPAAVTINQSYDILYSNGPTSRYLRQPRGPLTSSLLELLPESGRNRIRGALFRAGQDGKPVSVRVGIPDDSGRIRQVTIRISNLRESLYLVVFKEKHRLSSAPEEISQDVADMEEAAVRQLEQELSTTRDDLQGHIEQLKSLNEELHSSNEELQAANEELETSREELQSLNEELTTVNGQLQTKIEDEEETNNDLNNFLASTNIPTIFLDHRLRVKRFTPAMARLIKLLPGDVGRPIIDMSQAHLGPDLVADSQSVLDNLTPVTKELGINSAWHVRNILPYRTSDNRIEGVVITYTDITERKKAEEGLRASEEGLRLMVEGARDYALFMMDEKGYVATWNSGAERIKGWTSQEILGRYFSCFYPQESVDQGQPQRELEIATATGQYHEEGQRVRKDGSRFWADVTITALRDADGRLRGFAKLVRDITERKQAEERTEHLASYPQLNPNPIIEVDVSGKITFSNPGSQAILEKLGLDKEDLKTLLPSDMDAILSDWDKKSESVLDREVSLADRVFGETVHLVPQLGAARVYAYDITERKRAEEALRRAEEELRGEHDRIREYLNVAGVLLMVLDREGRVTLMNRRGNAILGYDEGELLGKDWITTCLPGTIKDEMVHAFEKLINGDLETVEYHENPVLTKQGEERIIAWHNTALRDETGNIIGSLSSGEDITEQKRAEEALRLSEEKFAVAFADNPAAIAMTRLEDGLFLEVNDTWVALNGYSREEVIGRSARTMHIWRTTEASTRFVQELQEKGSLHGWEEEFIKKSGEVFVAQLSAQTLTLGGEKVILSTFVDVTERKRAEERLRMSEEHYRSLFDNMLNGYAYCKMLFDANGPKDFTYLSVNAAFETLTGLKNVTGKNVSDVIPGIRQSDPELFEIYGRVALTGTPERFETYVEALGMWFSVSVYSPQKEYFVAVFDVITERKLAEQALRRSRDELEEHVLERTEALRRQADLLELAYNTIIVRDLDNRVTFWNARAEEIYGFTREEALGQVTHALLRTKFPVPFEEHMAVLTTQGRWEGELVHTTKDGRQIVVLSRQALQRDEAGRPVAIMEINLDVTEERRIEGHLRQAQKMEALGTLSGGIAHDFNNILAAIIGFTELVTGHVDHGSRDAHALERVMEAAIRGRELVRQMLTFSRKSEHEKKPVRLSGIVRESVRLLRAAVPSNIAIKVDVTSESGFILADPVQIQQVLMNLCTNAAQAMREKGGTLDIKLDDFSAGPSGSDFGIAPGLYMRLLVRDTGIGMSADIMGKVFDPFFTTKGLGEGTGLGLSVVHGIVKQHDGHITVESEAGKGSTFTVYIPQIPEELETDAVSDDELPTGSERILFVDDEEALVEMAEDILAELGYEVTSRMNGREALELLKSDPSRFDLVITDQTMPEMTGMDLAGEILAIRPNMPIIMCTGFSHLVDADKALAAGIKAFAMKPLTKREIARTIRNVLDE
jgi:two-component system CheB/CheR fusion protein